MNRQLLYVTFLVLPYFSNGEESSNFIEIPERFKLIGEYEMVSKVKVENGLSLQLMTSPLVYQVYSDGIDVRVYNKGGEERSYKSYHIYSSDGIGVLSESSEIEYVAGVQAIFIQGDMVRQMSLTRDNLVMVKTPPRSNRVLITYARVISEKNDKIEN